MRERQSTAIALRAVLRATSCCALLVAGLAGTAAAGPRAFAPAELLVRFQGSGEHALDECAEALHRRGRGFRSATRDASDSLDRLQQRFGVRRVRALFRRADGRPLEQQRADLRQRQERLRARRGLRPRVEPPDLSHVYRVELAEGASVPSAVASFREDPHVVWAQPNFRVEYTYLENGAPDDTYFGSIGTWGQPYEDLFGLFRMRAPEAWTRARGEGVIVAVNDSGLDYTHPDIVENVWVNPGEDLNGDGRRQDFERNGIDDDGNGFIDDFYGFDFHNSFDLDEDGRFDGPNDRSDANPFDDNGHGSHVSGIVAAVGDNGIGVVGVAPRARIMAVKGLGESGGGRTDALARGIVYAAENGARVVNNSWSCSQRCPSNPIAEEAVRLAYALGVVVVFSAGNKSDEVGFYSPQNMSETITVGASNPADEPAGFSNRGFGMDVVAPGAGFADGPPDSNPTSGVLSLLSLGSSIGGPLVVGGRYLRLAGTSMAAPHVSGLAALLLSQNPELTPDEVKLTIRASASDLGPPGQDRESGAGLVDAAAALSLAAPAALYADIASPAFFETLRRADASVAIRGSAAGEGFGSYRLFVGRTQQPASWLPLAPEQYAPVVDGELGRWDPSGEPPDIYVLRLSVRGLDGSLLESYVTVSLELNPPRRVGGTPANDFRPDLSGNRVVFESTHSVSGEDEGVNVFVAELDDDTEDVYPLATTPSDERRPSTSGRHVAWESWTESGSEIQTCIAEGPDWICRPWRVGASQARGPRLEGDRAVWMASEDGRLSIHRCRLEGDEGCLGDPLAASPSAQLHPDLSGDRFVWSGSGLYTCVLDAASGACPEARVTPLTVLPELPSLSGRLFTWTDYANGFRDRVLRACELDPVSGECPVLTLETLGAPSAAQVSGKRIVWSDRGQGSDREIFFCEYDGLTQTCPVQQLTTNPFDQLSATIDGDTVVWVDQRNGLDSDLYALELPSLAPIGPRQAAEGEPLVVEVTGSDPNGDPVELSAEGLDRPLEELGATFVDRGDGTGALHWKPGYDQAGTHRVRFALDTLGQLRSQESIAIVVLDVNRPPVVRVPRVPRAERREAFRIDACASTDPDGDELSFEWRDLHRRLLGTGCAVSVEPPRRRRLRLVRLRVSDGRSESAALVLVRWPRR